MEEEEEDEEGQRERSRLRVVVDQSTLQMLRRLEQG